jgi:hypothetical protein
MNFFVTISFSKYAMKTGRLAMPLSVKQKDDVEHPLKRNLKLPYVAKLEAELKQFYNQL